MHRQRQRHAYQLKEEGEAHDERVGRKKILAATYHERPCWQVLPARRRLWNLAPQSSISQHPPLASISSFLSSRQWQDRNFGHEGNGGHEHLQRMWSKGKSRWRWFSAVIRKEYKTWGRCSFARLVMVKRRRVYLVRMHPPGAGDDLGVPCLASAHTGRAGLGDAVWRHCAHMTPASAVKKLHLSWLMLSTLIGVLSSQECICCQKGEMHTWSVKTHSIQTDKFTRST